MNHEPITEAMHHLDVRLIEEAARPVARKSRLRTAILAACLCLLIAIPTVAAGNLLVRHSHGKNLPNDLSDRGLDAYYELISAHRLPTDSLSQTARETAKEQTTFGFTSWDAMEDWLGIEVFDNAVLAEAEPTPLPLLDENGTVLQNDPCTLTLSTDDEGKIQAVLAGYYGKLQDEAISATAYALTDLSPDGSGSSMAMDYGTQTVQSQTSETYQTASGAEATIITTRLSGGEDLLDGLLLQNGFVVRITLSGAEKAELCRILDAFR